jgi:hypothetical protein
LPKRLAAPERWLAAAMRRNLHAARVSGRVERVEGAMRTAAAIAVVSVAWVGLACEPPRPPMTLGQGPRSGRIVWLRGETLRQVREWYAGPPRRVAVDYETADRFLAEGNIAMAKSAYSRIIAWFPAGPQRRVAEFWVAYCDELLGNAPAAAQRYGKVARMPSEKPSLWSREAARRRELLVRAMREPRRRLP